MRHIGAHKKLKAAGFLTLQQDCNRRTLSPFSRLCVTCIRAALTKTKTEIEAQRGQLDKLD